MPLTDTTLSQRKQKWEKHRHQKVHAGKPQSTFKNVLRYLINIGKYVNYKLSLGDQITVDFFNQFLAFSSVFLQVLFLIGTFPPIKKFLVLNTKNIIA